MKKIILKTLVFTIIIGTIGIAFYKVFGEVGFIKAATIPGTDMTWYTFDFHNYFLNMEQNLKQLSFLNILPKTPDIPSISWTEGFKMLGKILFLVINWIMYVMSIIVLAPIKLIFYIVLVVISILGINFNNLREIAQTIYNFTLPYLDYAVL